MKTTKIVSPTSRVRIGIARADITPPTGMYHRLWGAATHDRATGTHKPLLADILTLGSVKGTKPELLRVFVDFVSLDDTYHEELVDFLRAAVALPAEKVIISYSHTHSSGIFSPERLALPGGEMIPAYMGNLQAKLADAAREACTNMKEAYITYAQGRCDMAANRDGWDEKNQCCVCGYNPGAPADDTMVVGRITDTSGAQMATIVHYACHATTLAWENTLWSPDYAGALRELVASRTGGPCIFLQGACGDLGPRCGFVGDPSVADQNGRWVAYAALSALESMGPVAMDYQYQGPVISGATLGIWKYRPFTEEREERTACFAGGAYSVELPLKSLPSRESLQADLDKWLSLQKEALQKGETIPARNYGAQGERTRRWLARLPHLPAGNSYPFPFSVHRMGDAVWITCGGEPYNYLQRELRRCFPHYSILVSPLSGGFSAGYLLDSDSYDKGFYQEEPSILAKGCLEILTDAIAEKITRLLS